MYSHQVVKEREKEITDDEAEEDEAKEEEDKDKVSKWGACKRMEASK